MNLNAARNAVIGLGTLYLIAGTAQAGSHLWDITEVFTNADGSIQFIEMTEQNGAANETLLSGRKITCDLSGNEFTFPETLTPPTSFKHLLLATQSFADLPGAPAPDYIIPENFFSVSGDTLRYHIYDTWAITPGAMPADCVSSYNRVGGVAPNSPTNYAGDTATIDAWTAQFADLNEDRVVDTADLGALIGQFGTPGPGADLNEDGVVDTADLGLMIGVFGLSCP